MKKVASIFVFSLVFISVLGASNPVTNTPLNNSNNEEPGKVIFIRDTGVSNWLFTIKAFSEGTFLGEFTNNSITHMQFQPGTHQLNFKMVTLKEDLKLQVESNETKYVLLYLKEAPLTYKINAIEITESSALKLMEELSK